MQKVLFMDTETTGLKHDENDIIEIAGVLTEGTAIIDEFVFKCRPLNVEAISPMALATNNYTIEQIMEWEDPKQSVLKMVEFFNKHTNNGKEKMLMAGQNFRGFDLKFIISFFNKNANDKDKWMNKWFQFGPYFDLMDLTKPMKKYGYMDVENVKLGTIVESLGITVEGSLHNALADIKVTSKAFFEMLPKVKQVYEQEPKHKMFTENLVNILQFYA